MAENIAQYLHPAGINLGYSTVSTGGPFTLVNNLNTLDPPELKKGRVAATSVSAGNKQLRKRPGWQDPGEFKFTVYRDSGTQFDTFGAFYAAETVLFWQILTSDAQPHNFTGWIGNVKPLGTVNRDSDEFFLDEYTVVLTDDLPTVHGVTL